MSSVMIVAIYRLNRGECPYGCYGACPHRPDGQSNVTNHAWIVA